MREGSFQFSLWSMHVAVACVALVLGAALSGPVRLLIVCLSFGFVLLMGGAFVCVGLVFVLDGAKSAGHLAEWLVRSPLLVRQYFFERRLARLRPGNSSQRVRNLLGSPIRVEGFGDRLYWSYRIAGQRYTVSLDPRRLVAKYSNGLTRDQPRQRA